MKKFAFRLEKVLELRRYKEKEVELRLAAKEGECLQLEHLILALMQRNRQAFLERGQSAMDISALLAYDNFSRRMEKEIERNQQLLVQKQMEREVIQREFLEVQKKRKVLDKLKEKKYVAFRQEFKREEIKRLDDLSTAAFLRKKAALEVSLG